MAKVVYLQVRGTFFRLKWQRKSQLSQVYRAVSFCLYLCAVHSLSGRKIKFNAEVLNETDANGDFISMGCRPGPKEDEAMCIFCSKVIHCSYHGVNAVKRHATNKQHVEARKQHRVDLGALEKPATTQSLLESCRATRLDISVTDRVTLAETFCSWSSHCRNTVFMGRHSDINFSTNVSRL